MRYHERCKMRLRVSSLNLMMLTPCSALSLAFFTVFVANANSRFMHASLRLCMILLYRIVKMDCCFLNIW